MKRKVILTTAALLGLITLAFTVRAEGLTLYSLMGVSHVFYDVNADQWYTDAVQYMYDNDYMVGMDRHFGTSEPLTRSAVVQVLYSISGKPDVTYTNHFNDVPEGEWYTDAVLWAYQEGITSGYANGSFGVGDSITREQLALMLYRFADMKGYAVNYTDTVLDGYSDKADISSWAMTGLKWAVTQGVISGKDYDGDVQAAPQDTATRAECAVMMYKLMGNRVSEWTGDLL